MRKIALRVCFGLGIAYAGLVGAVALFYRVVLYPAPKQGVEPLAPKGTLLPLGAESDASFAYFIAPPEGAPVVVTFHGNGEELADKTWLARDLEKAGLGVLMVEYPGYGLAKAGTPTEASLYAAGERALARLAELGVARDRVVIMGQSLGSGVAMEMAARGHGVRLVLISPFTSIVDMVSHFVPIVPARLVVGDRYASLEKAPRVAIPTLVVHGDEDTLVPFAMGERLAAALPHARMRRVAGAGHNDVFQRERGVVKEIVDFLRDDAVEVPR